MQTMQKKTKSIINETEKVTFLQRPGSIADLQQNLRHEKNSKKHCLMA